MKLAMQHMQPMYFALISLENLSPNKPISVALSQGQMLLLDSSTPHRQLSCKSTFLYWRHDLETQDKAVAQCPSCFMLLSSSRCFLWLISSCRLNGHPPIPATAPGLLRGQQTHAARRGFHVRCMAWTLLQTERPKKHQEAIGCRCLAIAIDISYRYRNDIEWWRIFAIELYLHVYIYMYICMGVS